MVGIAQSNNFNELSRRVGFSVGLFKTKERLLEVLNIYIKNEGVTFRDVYPIVQNWVKTGDKKENLNHYSDVFSALNLFEFDIKKGTFLPKYLLEVLYLLKKVLSEKDLNQAIDIIFFL